MRVFKSASWRLYKLITDCLNSLNVKIYMYIYSQGRKCKENLKNNEHSFVFILTFIFFIFNTEKTFLKIQVITGVKKSVSAA